MKAVRLLIESSLPPELRKADREYSAGDLNDLLVQVAQRYPDSYEKISSMLADYGRNASFKQGETLTLEDLRPVIDKQQIFAAMRKDIAQAKTSSKTDDEFTAKRLKIWGDYSDLIEKETQKAALAKNNNIALAVLSGARGKSAQLKTMISTPGIYADSKGRPVPLFIENSHSDGLRPYEYLASTYGARSTVISTKNSTAKGGDLCLAKGTLVRMADYTTKPIEEVLIGDYVLGADKAGNTFPVKVVNRFEQGIKKVSSYVVEASGFSETVVCTANHKFLSVDRLEHSASNIKPIGELYKNERLVRPRIFNDSRMFDEPMALLCGLLLGDGTLPSYAPKSRVAFTCFDSILIKDTSDYLATLGLHWQQRKTQPNQFRVSKSTKSWTHPVKDFLKEEGIVGLKSFNKKLPSSIKNWSNSSILELFAGLVATDGSLTLKTTNGAKYPNIIIHSTSVQLLSELRELMQWRFGISGSKIHACKPREITIGETNIAGNLVKSFRQGYSWAISAQRDLLILKQVGFKLPGCKNLKWIDFCNANYWGNKRKATSGNPKITVASAIGELECFDIEVDHHDHLFVLACGLICSNSKQLVSISAPLVVTNKKSPTDNGIDLDINDDSLKYRVLSRPTAGYPAGTLITSRVLSDIRKSDSKYVMVYSPITDTSEEGISAESVGALNGGKLYSLGSSAGITSSQAIGEPITQMALNAKHCLLEGTQVRMADFSIRKIETIKPGEFVLGADITGRTFPVKVKAVWDQGIQPVYRYAYRMGQTTQLLTLESTDCHQILSNTKKSSCKEAALNTTLRKLPAGYKSKNVAAVLPTSYDDAGKTETKIALLMGVFLGDGIRTTRDSAARISCADPKMIEDLGVYAEPLNIRFVKRERSHDWGVVLINDDIADFRKTDGTVVAKVRNPLKKALEQYALLGKYAHEKRLPEEVLRDWDNNSVASLIAGFIATDGSIYSNKDGQIGLSLSSSSFGLLEDIKTLLMLRLGVPSTAITRTGKAGEGNRKHDQWQFTVTRISELRKLRKALPAIPGVKEKRFNDLLDKARYNRNDEFYRCKRVDSEFLGNKQCWDISVDHVDELFVLANGLIVKNTGGVAGKKKTFAGFNTINQFVQSPEAFANKATVSELDGMVEKIDPAPQGGNYIYVNGQEHYTPPGYELTVKLGDTVEPGDALSDGIADPRDIVRLRGLGEGRKYYATRLKTILDDSGIKTDRKHTEMVARAALDHMVVTDPDGLGTYLPDDEVSYNALAANYVPPKDTVKLDSTKAVGKYLQAPALHYTIGTKLTKRMAQHLADREIKDVLVSDTEPGFAPSMTRLRTAAHSMPDWLAKMQTSYLGKNLQESAVRGEDTNIAENVHFAPRLAVGAGFGTKSEQTGKF